MFSTDADLFLEEGELATYDGSASVRVHFDRPYLEALDAVAGTQPQATGKASDFADPVGKTLQIGADLYTIVNREPIDDGVFVVLRLRAPE